MTQNTGNKTFNLGLPPSFIHSWLFYSCPVIQSLQSFHIWSSTYIILAITPHRPFFCYCLPLYIHFAYSTSCISGSVFSAHYVRLHRKELLMTNCWLPSLNIMFLKLFTGAESVLYHPNIKQINLSSNLRHPI